MARSRRGRRGKRDRKPGVKRSASAAEQLREALGELREREDRSKRRRRRKRRHIDDYRELLLDGARPGELSQALLELTAESQRARGRLLSEGGRRVELPTAEGEDDVRKRAGRAVGELRAEMKKRGRAARTHHYSATERRETGEIDRTYEVGRGKQRERPQNSS